MANTLFSNLFTYFSLLSHSFHGESRYRVIDDEIPQIQNRQLRIEQVVSCNCESIEFLINQVNQLKNECRELDRRLKKLETKTKTKTKCFC